MAIRLYPLTVLVFWLAAMSWLVVEKIVPAWRQGEPPNYLAVSAAQLRTRPPVVWDMRWNQNRIGWAATDVVDSPDGRSELVSLIQFTDRPKAESMAMRWLVDQFADWTAQGRDFRIQIRNRSRLSAKGALEQIDSVVTLDGSADATPWMEIHGDVDGNELRLTFRIGGQNEHHRVLPIRPKSLVTHELSPRGFMPPLHLHQQWTTYPVSPVRPPTGPQQPIVARVERYAGIVWDGRAVETFLVVYRKDEGAGTYVEDEPFGRMWVRPDDGMVLKQEVKLLGSRLTFVRRSEAAATPLLDQLPDSWKHDPDGPPVARSLTESDPRSP